MGGTSTGSRRRKNRELWRRRWMRAQVPERGRGEVANEGEKREGERGSGSGAALSLMAREEENKRWERWIERGSPGGAARGKRERPNEG